MIKFLLFFLSLFFLSFFYGCSPTGIIASGGATTMIIAEGDRSLGTVIDDATIKINIAQKFLNSENNLFLKIETKVIEGRVLLTGIADNQESRINAIQRVWEVNGVKEVINEIQIGDKTTLKEYTNDLWINTQIKALAAKNIGLRVLSYNFETIRGKVFIAGITSRPEQLEIVIQSARKVKGVKEIVNYVVIKEKLSD